MLFHGHAVDSLKQTELQYEALEATMNTKRFKITYTNPETKELVTIEKDFDNSPAVSAETWADDYAYSIADKGHYHIKEIPQ